MRYALLCAAALLLAGCVARWTPAEKKLALADGFCIAAEVANQTASVGHCAPAED